MPNARVAEYGEGGRVGTVDASLDDDGRIDRCPECGHGTLTYHLT